MSFLKTLQDFADKQLEFVGWKPKAVEDKFLGYALLALIYGLLLAVAWPLLLIGLLIWYYNKK